MPCRAIIAVSFSLLSLGVVEAQSHHSRGASRTTLLQWNGYRGDSTPHAARPLASDRPDFTEASSTVGLGVAQWEMGYTYTRDDDTATTAETYPELLGRIGIFADWLELRVAWTYADERTRVPAFAEANGFEDLYLGLKIALTDQCGCLPETALMPQMTVPTGGSRRTNDEVLPGLIWLYTWQLNDRLAFAGNSGINRIVDGQQQDAIEVVQSLSLAASLTDRLGAYSEWFVIAPSGAEGIDTEHYFDGGFTVAITDDIQWDVRGGIGLSDAADDYFVGSGLVIRVR